jgi:hypothetical protein
MALTMQAAKELPVHVRLLVSELGVHESSVVQSFGIPDQLLSAPIAGDCE